MDGQDDWKKRPMVVPMTVRVQPGIHSQEIHIMHPLNTGISSDKAKEEFVEKEAADIAKQTHGDVAFIRKQLEQANRLFHDAEGRRLDPEVVVLTVVAPVAEDSDAYMLLHRCYWDLHTPHAMVDVYCGELVNDMGFDCSTAQLLSASMKSEIDAMRQGSVSAPTNSTPIEETREDARVVFPMVIKGGRDVAERLKATLQDVPFGQERKYV